MVIDSDKRYTFNVDGEMVTDNHFEIEMRKNAVKVFCNKEFNGKNNRKNRTKL